MDELEVPIDPPTGDDTPYLCDGCGRPVGRLNLKPKRVQFLDSPGKGARVERSRTVAYLCTMKFPDGGPSCVEADEAWNAPKYYQPRLAAESTEVLDG